MNLAISKALLKVLLLQNPPLQVDNGHVDIALDSDSSSIIAFLRQLWRNAVEPVIQLWLREVGRNNRAIDRRSNFTANCFPWRSGGVFRRRLLERCNLVWGLRGDARPRERTSGTRHGQTNKPSSSEATLPASLLGGGGGLLEVSGIEMEKGNAPSLL